MSMLSLWEQSQGLHEQVPTTNMSSLLVLLCLLVEATLEAAAEEPRVTQEPYGVFQNKCIEDLGCFYTGPPFFHPIYRPISLAPEDPKETKFLLYNRDFPIQPHLVNATEESVKNSNFDPGVPTKVLIHGYTVKLEEGDIRFTMKDELLKEGAYNVIIVDWSALNQFPYAQAVANARAVGALVAKLIQLFIDYKGIPPESVHVIGHSLGGQMAGWVGERILRMGRITGLDPAGPFFQHAPNPVRLDTTDANFVDVIHTNGGDNPIDGYGIDETIGHMDFYPNGGKTQPGCAARASGNETTDLNKLTLLENFIARSCDHSRANLLFLESINNCSFWGVQCRNYSSFQNGQCGAGSPVIAEMGFRAKKLIGLRGWPRFFLDTDTTPPYCQGNKPRLHY